MPPVRQPMLCALLGALCSLSCARTEVVAEGPLLLDATSREVPFSHPVTAYGPSCDLCLEFANPGKSGATSGVHVVLVTVEGRHDTLDAPSVDRRGEAMVCLIDRGVRARGRVHWPVQYRAALMWSEVPIRLRALRWYGGKAPTVP